VPGLKRNHQTDPHVHVSIGHISPISVRASCALKLLACSIPAARTSWLLDSGSWLLDSGEVALAPIANLPRFAIGNGS
jgi:hypothetical protein